MNARRAWPLGVFIAACAIVLAGCGESQDDTSTATNANIQNPPNKVHISTVSPIPYQEITLDGDEDTDYVVVSHLATKDQLVAITHDIEQHSRHYRAADATSNKGFFIYFVDDKREAGYGYTLGRAETTFDGQFRMCDDPDYSEGTTRYEFGNPNANGRMPRDDHNYPTQHQLDACFALIEPNNANLPIDEEIAKIAKQFHMSVSEAKKLNIECETR